ncbi:unnamed protein product [Linum trigynum]|uniref:Uncharacterized protein n=1 Tax=Linum trigynum TaxID=586398 RepID=A0AAV2CUE5_9ROSI
MIHKNSFGQPTFHLRRGTSKEPTFVESKYRYTVHPLSIFHKNITRQWLAEKSRQQLAECTLAELAEKTRQHLAESTLAELAEKTRQQQAESTLAELAEST